MTAANRPLKEIPSTTMPLAPSTGLALALLVLATSGCASAPPQNVPATGNSPATLAEGDPLMAALEQRLGRPDRITGSGRAFLHYDLPGAGSLTLVVSGNRIVGMQHEPLPDGGR